MVATREERLLVFREHEERTRVCVRWAWKRHELWKQRIERQDLYQEALVTLWQATEHYDCEAQTKFWTYAEKRVRGGIIDALRRDKWLSFQRPSRVASVVHYIPFSEHRLMQLLNARRLGRKTRVW